MRRFWIKIHKWLSIPVGLIIFIICLTGCVLIFEDELLEEFYPERYFVEHQNTSTPLPLAELIPKVNAQLDTNLVASVRIQNDVGRTYQMTLKKGFRVTAYVDQYTGEVKDVVSTRDTFMFKMMSLHRWMMDGSRTYGKYTVGITTLIFVFILISGFIVWIPKDKKKIRRRLVIKSKSGKKRLFYDLHSILGVYAFIFLLVCSLTGLMWSFDWYRNGVYTLLGTGAEKKEGGNGGRGQEQGAQGKGKRDKVLDVSQWDNALAEVVKIEPKFQQISIQTGSINIRPESAVHKRVSNKYEFSNETGEIISTQLYGETPLNTRIFHWAYALHVGAYGSGYWSKIITCLAVLIGTSLPITGYYLYFTKNRKKQRK